MPRIQLLLCRTVGTVCLGLHAKVMPHYSSGAARYSLLATCQQLLNVQVYEPFGADY